MPVVIRCVFDLGRRLAGAAGFAKFLGGRWARVHCGCIHGKRGRPVAVSAAAVDPPKPKGQQIHLFEVTVRVPDRSDDDPEEYNYRLLAKVLGSVEAARSLMYETELGIFSAYLTNNQARRLSKVPGVLKVTRREDPPPLPEPDGHL